jgi:hypothetical protein
VEGRNSNQQLVRGRLMATGNKTVTGTGTGLNLGSLAGKRLFSSFHLLAPVTTGVPAVVGTIESATTAGFTSPTVRMTHPSLTVRGADWQESVLGAGVADGYWRAKWTITGSSTFRLFWVFGWE